MLMMLGFCSVTHWLPQVIELKLHAGTVTSGLLSAIPWTVATAALLVVSRRTAQQGRRLTLCLGACIQVAVPLLYSFPSQYFPGAKGAVAPALVNSIGSIGGFIGPYLLGLLREATASDQAGLLVLSSSFPLAALLSLGLQRQLRQSPAYVPTVE